MNTCEKVRMQLSMLLYGELSFDEEEVVDAHLESCAECRTALDRERELHAAFDQAEIESPASVLWESRQNLQRQIAAEHVPAHRVSWWDQFLDARWLQSAGALALLSIGFFGARLAPNLGLGITGMSLVDPGAQRVRSVTPRISAMRGSGRPAK